MRLFFALTKKSFQRQMTYRAATLAGFVTNFFFGLLRAAIFIALYGQQSQVAGSAGKIKHALSGADSGRFDGEPLPHPVQTHRHEVVH